MEYGNIKYRIWNVDCEIGIWNGNVELEYGMWNGIWSIYCNSGRMVVEWKWNLMKVK
jgi:hypothetical protein